MCVASQQGPNPIYQEENVKSSKNQQTLRWKRTSLHLSEVNCPLSNRRRFRYVLTLTTKFLLKA